MMVVVVVRPIDFKNSRCRYNIAIARVTIETRLWRRSISDYLANVRLDSTRLDSDG